MVAGDHMTVHHTPAVHHVLRKKKKRCKTANGYTMSHLNTRIPDAEFVQTGPMSCHFVSWCQGLMLAFKDSDITINAQSYYGTLHDLCTTIERKHDVAR